MKQFLEALGRIANGVLDAINRKNKRDAVDNAADTISNGGVVQHSETEIGNVPCGSDSRSDQR